MADEVYPQPAAPRLIAPRAWMKGSEIPSVVLDDKRPGVLPSPGFDGSPGHEFPPPAGGHLEAPGMGRTRLGQPSEPAARDRALAAAAIARMAQLPSDLIVAEIVAGILVLRTKGISRLAITLALAEALQAPEGDGQW